MRTPILYVYSFVTCFQIKSKFLFYTMFLHIVLHCIYLTCIYTLLGNLSFGVMKLLNYILILLNTPCLVDLFQVLHCSLIYCSFRSLLHFVHLLFCQKDL